MHASEIINMNDWKILIELDLEHVPNLRKYYQEGMKKFLQIYPNLPNWHQIPETEIKLKL